MAYSDYGAFVWLNGKRRKDKEDVAAFATDEETFGTSSQNIPSGARIWILLMRNQGKRTWLTSIHHGVMGDGNIRVICHKQGRPDIYEATDDGFKSVDYCDDSVDFFDYEPIKFEYKGYTFYFESGKPYFARMTTPNGDVWECKYDYWYGAGFDDDH